jgi:hypothetical protein
MFVLLKGVLVQIVRCGWGLGCEDGRRYELLK